MLRPGVKFCAVFFFWWFEFSGVLVLVTWSVIRSTFFPLLFCCWCSCCCHLFFANLFAKFGCFFLYIVNRKQLILFLSRFFAINIVYCFLEFSYFSCIYLALFAKERDPNPNIKNVSSFVCLMLLSSLVAYYISWKCIQKITRCKISLSPMIPFFFILAALKFSEFAQTCFRLRRALRDRGGSEGGGALCRVGPLALTHTHVPVEERGKFCWELSRPPFGFPSGLIFALRFSWCFRLTLLNFL